MTENKDFSYLLQVYNELRQLPPKIIIDRPDEKIYAGVINGMLKPILPFQNTDVYFTRRSLKHIAEKSDGMSVQILEQIATLIYQPHEIRHARNQHTRIDKRYLFVSRAPDSEKYITTVVEIGGSNTIITTYLCPERYLSNFDLLWRAAVPPSAYPPEADAGSLAVSALREDQNQKGIL